MWKDEKKQERANYYYFLNVVDFLYETDYYNVNYFCLLIIINSQFIIFLDKISLFACKQAFLKKGVALYFYAFQTITYY